MVDLGEGQIVFDPGSDRALVPPFTYVFTFTATIQSDLTDNSRRKTINLEFTVPDPCLTGTIAWNGGVSNHLYDVNYGD